MKEAFPNLVFDGLKVTPVGTRVANASGSCLCVIEDTFLAFKGGGAAVGVGTRYEINWNLN